MKKIRIIENEEVTEVSIEELIQKYNRLIYKICNSWQKSFLFDQSIELEDLAQDLKLKLLNDLHNYDYKKNEHIMPYISKIAKNFFISKKAKILTNDKCPLNEENKPELIISLYNGISKDVENVKLIETLISHRQSPDSKLLLNELVKNIQCDLDKIPYCPKEYVRRIRSFCRIVFDLIYYQKEKFTNFVCFNFRCKQRYARNAKKKSIPRTIIISTDAISRYMRVKVGAVNYANIKIKETIKKIIS